MPPTDEQRIEGTEQPIREPRPDLGTPQEEPDPAEEPEEDLPLEQIGEDPDLEIPPGHAE